LKSWAATGRIVAAHLPFALDWLLSHHPGLLVFLDLVMGDGSHAPPLFSAEQPGWPWLQSR
jgi:hypothetical protein